MENMKLLIDTNVILDMFFQRNGSDNSMKLFRKIRDNGDSAYISASSVTDLFYIIRKEVHDMEKTYVIMENIFKLVSVLSVTEKDIQDAFRLKWKDFEDCVQYMTAKNNGADCIITVNVKDYADAELPVRTPSAWIMETGSQ